MEKKKILKIAFAIAISASAITAVAPTHSQAASAVLAKAQSEAATSLNSKISNAKIAMKKPYDRYIKSTGKLAEVKTVASDIAKAKKAQKDVNAAIKKAKISSKQKKAKYAQVKAYAKYIERAQGYVNAYQAASKAGTTFANLSGKLARAIVIKDVTAIQEQSAAFKNAITAAKKEINHTVYGEKVKDLLFKKFTTPTENQVAAIKALYKDLFSAVLTKAKTQTALKDILDTAPENAYVAIDVTGATENLTFTTTKALNITVKGDLSGRNITINTPNSDIVNNATNVGTVIINDVSNNSFHQGSGTVELLTYNDTNGGHITDGIFTKLFDIEKSLNFRKAQGDTDSLKIIAAITLNKLLRISEEITNNGAKNTDPLKVYVDQLINLAEGMMTQGANIALTEGTKVNLSGSFGTVIAEGNTTVTVDTGSKVGTLVSNGDVTLTAPKGAISEISGSGTVAPTPTSEFNDSDVKNAGGTPASTTDSTQTPATTDPSQTPATGATAF